MLAGEAQAQMGAHGALLRRPEPRPLRARLALADAVAIATVDRVELGRIFVRSGEPVLGEVPGTFELKRAPSEPPPLEPGDEAVLLLRGARSPYVLVDEPFELVVLADAEGRARWREALRAHRAAGDRADDLLALYTGWLSSADPDLARAAVVGLGDPRAPFRPVGPELLERLARIAVDPDRDPELRRTASQVLLAADPGAEALLALLPGGPGADPQILVSAISVAAVRGRRDVRDVIGRALVHPDAAIRMTALRLGRYAALDPEMGKEVARMAAEDPDERVREAARRALGE